ncbi:efflux RND transporter periplasmic adaptor subunit [Campylobacter hominis]|uniref:MacA n=1 Tax=Campylobacter hominis (strain ATCC BAA-381 / DSM 21671 / CCUG 45161 / LMG 19568 / NCTC 13146 / CH001A) TaxID=360107 RepID=A7I297_CAMHC|nr:efflux RND transporter periplasmic adaptor subunit [Campylobacter hominis]ABS52509.1 MacA [Campylobacter hominis ATCC BAA-381]UAK86092.1 efflux RND transporter periplasmic adaptor subunit [Campylobacter hominis]SUW85163.1 MacA [Campylobacter hominis]
MKKFIKFGIFCALALILIWFFLFKKDEEAPNFITTKLQSGDIKSVVIANGEVYAQDLVDVGAQVSGQIKKLYVKVGDNVKKGDMIAQIDSEKQENEISKEKAQLVIYEANLKAAEIKAQNAKIQFLREQKLYKKDATSKEKLENAKNEAALSAANVKQIQAQIEQTKLALDTAETNLGYTKISAPLDGTIVSVPVEEGRTVNANQTTPTIVKIADLSKMEIRLQISEGDISLVKVGQNVEYTILSALDDIKKAEISSIDPALTTLSDGSYDKTNLNGSSSSNEAVYFYAKVLVDDNDGFLKIGMTTQNTIIVNEAKNVNFITSSAIQKDTNNERFVWILKDKTPTKAKIKIGISDNLNTQILSGINKNDEIIISNPNKSENSKSIARPPFERVR